MNSIEPWTGSPGFNFGRQALKYYNGTYLSVSEQKAEVMRILACSLEHSLSQRLGMQWSAYQMEEGKV